MLEYKGYVATVKFEEEDGVFYGVICGSPDLIDFIAETEDKVEQEFHSAVDDYLAFCQEVGKEPDQDKLI